VTERQQSPSDVEPLVWGVLGGGALAVVTVLTLLVSSHFTGRGLLLVFAVPLVMLVGAGVGRRRGSEDGDPGPGGRQEGGN